nr:cyclophilin-like fold protein [Herbiconiux sp. VKM Ac-2851]
MSTGTRLTITVDGTTVTAVLRDSAATASLVAQLPLDLEFEDFGGQEKIARLPAPLMLDGLPSGGGAEPGTIGYYAPDQALVLYYDAVAYYEGIIPLGTFDDVPAVRDAAPFTGTVSVAGPGSEGGAGAE